MKRIASRTMIDRWNQTIELLHSGHPSSISKRLRHQHRQEEINEKQKLEVGDGTGLMRRSDEKQADNMKFHLSHSASPRNCFRLLRFSVLSCHFHSNNMSFKGKSKKGSILDLNKYMDQQIRVKFSGGREGQFNQTKHPND